jgi:hypothetical protein
MKLAYNEFIERIDEFVGKTVVFTATHKITKRTNSFVRKVWDNKEFGKQAENGVFVIHSVEIR